MKAGIVLDNWKLPVFRRMLNEAGFSYEDGGAVTHDTTGLIVQTDDIVKLTTVVKKCRDECAANKGKR